VRNLTTANPAFNARVDALKGAFGHGFEAIHAAEAYIYNQLHRQAAMLAYLDIIQYLAVFCACMLPLLFLIPRPPKNASPSAGH